MRSDEWAPVPAAFRPRGTRRSHDGSALFPPPPPGEASSHTGDGLSLTMLTAEEVRGRFDACCNELGRFRGWSAGQRKAELDRTKESKPQI